MALRLWRAVLVAAAMVAAALPSSSLGAQRILRWTELNAAQLASLDRARTAVLIPAGIVEEQGTLLPAGAEIFHTEKLTADLASSIAARPGWTVLLLPTVPLGSGAFDQRMGRTGFSGSLPVRPSTLQAIFTDLGAALGQQGFQHLFIVDGHAEPTHARALDLAGDAFGAQFRGQMIHLLGRSGCALDGLEAPPITLYSATAMTADADSPHGGTRQTALAWWLRPDLADSAQIRRAPDVTAGSEQRATTARRSDWPGYVGAPRHATLELGQWLYETERRNCSDLAHRFLDGLDARTVPRFSDRMRAGEAQRTAMDAAFRGDTGSTQRRLRRPARSTLPR